MEVLVLLLLLLLLLLLILLPLRLLLLLLLLIDILIAQPPLVLGHQHNGGYTNHKKKNKTRIWTRILLTGASLMNI